MTNIQFVTKNAHTEERDVYFLNAVYGPDGTVAGGASGGLGAVAGGVGAGPGGAGLVPGAGGAGGVGTGALKPGKSELQPFFVL